MKKHFGGLVCVLFIISTTLSSWKPANVIRAGIAATKPFTSRELLEKYVDNIYESAHLQESGLAVNVFKKALTGFINLKIFNKLPQTSSIITVIDYSKSSTVKRMWIIDVANKALVLHTWVAHGNGSGKQVATRFSDKMNSFKSSLGFYLTDRVYYGKHGRSLRLDGMDAGFNTNARAREIVVHAADYVGQNIIEEQGRLGCSQGCPAVSPNVADQVIDAIKDKTVIFINGTSSRYSSKYLDEEQAANFVASNSNSNYIANL
ncbi:MAG TPA: murein L,D-transpeptidase catalytic domain family protein [Mucilaginibacter sp.]